ncbi:hypothetical protein AN964_14065 [Heyndrickxia shackletonii]|uniref:DUF3168 domain-containing protein n=1 Tax=Heyndrickxia shackletonii TaxID=157838 RepID=A0A0Q3WYG2_9BACI|nr:hypothetical protein [Heyndrickxia shackletonii]KQL54511.1 hypothetical protein AN964_14065 [Heyndrickxia shackletonii]NEY99243.1 DUF3168 domain-containing protein [Heyndrickxia shackletonii]
MDFEEALRAELVTIDGLSNKVFPLNATEGTKPPYIIYVSSEGIQDKTLDGYQSNKEAPCEINIVHNSYENLKSMTKQVLDKIVSFEGRVIGKDGPFIQELSYDKPIELYENEISAYRSVINFTVNF